MFSSNSRRASTVSDAVDTAGDDVALAGTCAQPIAAMITTIRVDENLVDAIRLCEKAPEILIGDFVLRDSCELLTDNLFQNRNATRQVASAGLLTSPIRLTSIAAGLIEISVSMFVSQKQLFMNSSQLAGKRDTTIPRLRSSGSGNRKISSKNA